MHATAIQSDPESQPRKRIAVRADAVLKPMYETIGKRPAETSGILGLNAQTGVITHFLFDDKCARTAVSNSPHVDGLNKIINEEWVPNGTIYAGAPHSHPIGARHPSSGDIAYGLRILKAKRSLPELQVWIIMPEQDGHPYEVLPFTLDRAGRLVAVEIVPVDEKDQPINVDIRGEAATTDTADDQAGKVQRPVDILVETAHRTPIDVSRQFDRVRDAYDAQRLVRSRIIWIGAGGVRETIENTARAGVEEHVIIDPDIVTDTNIGTQPVFRHEIGKPKAEAIKDVLLEINPNARVIAIHAPVEAIDDDAFERLLFGPRATSSWPGRPDVYVKLEPVVTVSVAATDSFEAQARNNRIGLKWGIPTMNSQVYERGLGAEVTFTHTETTRACHRCLLCQRYRAYLHEGFRNAVGSSGAPICATQRLGGLESFILMALLHHGSKHQRFGPLLSRIGNRNLIQIRMAPDMTNNLGLKVFDRVFERADRQRILFDDTVWLPQEPENGRKGRPVCPECGGTGNLRDSIGKLEDTRIMPS